MLENEILQYIIKGNRRINVISPMNSDGSILGAVIRWATQSNMKIIYISDNTKKAQSIIGKARGSLKENGVVLKTFNEAMYTYDKYDIVIYDELGSRPVNSKENIRGILEEICGSYGSIITYSFEPIFDHDKKIYRFNNKRKTPIMEPRVITTRINLQEEISNYVYDYIKWSINTNKKVLVYVPDGYKADKVYKAFKAINSSLRTILYKGKSSDGSDKEISRFIVASTGVMITDNLFDGFSGMHGTNVMMFFADDPSINYRDLIYVSSKGDELAQNGCNEVIFICRTETPEIDKCKKVLRELNKRAWEQGLLRV